MSSLAGPFEAGEWYTKQGKQQAVYAQRQDLLLPLCCGFGTGAGLGPQSQSHPRCNRTLSSWLTQSWRVIASLPLALRRPRDSGVCWPGVLALEFRAQNCCLSPESVSASERQSWGSCFFSWVLMPSRRGSPVCAEHWVPRGLGI